MAQVVIFAPEGEDVSAGEQALTDAGHTVEVVEATPENLLHMAIGMIEHHKSKHEKKEGDKEPKPEEGAEEPAPEADPLAEPVPAEGDTTKMESLGKVTVEGEIVEAFAGKQTRLFVEKLVRGDKVTFMLGETELSSWDGTQTMIIESEKAYVPKALTVYQSKQGKTYLEVGQEDRKLF